MCTGPGICFTRGCGLSVVFCVVLQAEGNVPSQLPLIVSFPVTEIFIAFLVICLGFAFRLIGKTILGRMEGAAHLEAVSQE